VARQIGLEQVTAAQHLERSCRMPVEPAVRPIALHAAAQRRDAAVHAIQIHRVDQIGPLERRLRVMHE